MKPVLIVQNDAKEGAGQLSTLMAERGIPQHTVFGYNADYGELRSDPYSALVVLGGAQSVCDTGNDPYLLDEIGLCQDFLSASKPIAGFCLGAQILARSVGGRVAPGAQKEIGWYDLTLDDAAADDALMKAHPKRLLSYHFHGDRIETVPNCVKLASSELTEFQLFRCRHNAYGFQYHAEVDGPLVETMCLNNSDYLASSGFDAQAIIDDSRLHMPAFERHCRDVLTRWLDLFADPSSD